MGGTPWIVVGIVIGNADLAPLVAPDQPEMLSIVSHANRMQSLNHGTNCEQAGQHLSGSYQHREQDQKEYQARMH